ncbi:MAG: hypothetical protein FWD71_02675 [Oscillospiraceae bacterium]|nr:hypothetical protein [Oscillospiraceae bacterium]
MTGGAVVVSGTVAASVAAVVSAVVVIAATGFLVGMILSPVVTSGVVGAGLFIYPPPWGGI